MAERRLFRNLRLRFEAKDGGVGGTIRASQPMIDGHFVGYRGVGRISHQMYDALKVRRPGRAERVTRPSPNSR